MKAKPGSIGRSLLQFARRQSGHYLAPTEQAQAKALPSSWQAASQQELVWPISETDPMPQGEADWFDSGLEMQPPSGSNAPVSDSPAEAESGERKIPADLRRILELHEQRKAQDKPAQTAPAPKADRQTIRRQPPISDTEQPRRRARIEEVSTARPQARIDQPPADADDQAYELPLLEEEQESFDLRTALFDNVADDVEQAQDVPSDDTSAHVPEHWQKPAATIQKSPQDSSGQTAASHYESSHSDDRSQLEASADDFDADEGQSSEYISPYPQPDDMKEFLNLYGDADTVRLQALNPDDNLPRAADSARHETDNYPDDAPQDTDFAQRQDEQSSLDTDFARHETDDYPDDVPQDTDFARHETDDYPDDAPQDTDFVAQRQDEQRPHEADFSFHETDDYPDDVPQDTDFVAQRQDEQSSIDTDFARHETDDYPDDAPQDTDFVAQRQDEQRPHEADFSFQETDDYPDDVPQDTELAAQEQDDYHGYPPYDDQRPVADAGDFSGEMPDISQRGKPSQAFSQRSPSAYPMPQEPDLPQFDDEDYEAVFQIPTEEYEYPPDWEYYKRQARSELPRRQRGASVVELPGFHSAEDEDDLDRPDETVSPQQRTTRFERSEQETASQSLSHSVQREPLQAPDEDVDEAPGDQDSVPAYLQYLASPASRSDQVQAQDDDEQYDFQAQGSGSVTDEDAALDAWLDSIRSQIAPQSYPSDAPSPQIRQTDSTDRPRRTPQQEQDSRSEDESQSLSYSQHEDDTRADLLTLLDLPADAQVAGWERNLGEDQADTESPTLQQTHQPPASRSTAPSLPIQRVSLDAALGTQTPETHDLEINSEQDIQRQTDISRTADMTTSSDQDIDQEQAPDMNKLAEDVYRLLKQRLRIERERRSNKRN